MMYGGRWRQQPERAARARLGYGLVNLGCVCKLSVVALCIVSALGCTEEVVTSAGQAGAPVVDRKAQT